MNHRYICTHRYLHYMCALLPLDTAVLILTGSVNSSCHDNASHLAPLGCHHAPGGTGWATLPTSDKALGSVPTKKGMVIHIKHPTVGLVQSHLFTRRPLTHSHSPISYTSHAENRTRKFQAGKHLGSCCFKTESDLKIVGRSAEHELKVALP